ncbi:hypothetical protein APT_00794 [Acetobacter pasteurianus NBRC 101655]|uniref:hypothetical protein n=1 Tax=Acetobacter pasteurianus TaxID=438 RepID=UPI000245734E|nr:hypothetical protein [Acetobacter pasteurianus]BAU37876.1 hypothetical protein APT_00794 [Acetobacter pasteurianus NBRC 101655]
MAKTISLSVQRVQEYGASYLLFALQDDGRMFCKMVSALSEVDDAYVSNEGGWQELTPPAEGMA